MSKIMILTNHSYMLWQFRRELIQKLLKQGEVILAMPFVGHEDDFKQMGCKCIEIKIDRRGTNPITDLRLYYAYRKLLKKERPDKVITYSIKPNVYGGYACRRLGTPLYANVQGLGTAFQSKKMAMIAGTLYRVALKKAKVVFFENTANAKVFIDRNIIKEEKIVVLNGAGVNTNHFSYKEYPSEDNGIHFLYLGRIMKEKGVDELFDAAIEIKKEYGNKVIFDLVGFFDDEYKETVEKLALDGTVVFHGFQEEPRPFYEMAHCVILPSYHEGMSNVLLEAAATGRAIITSDIPGCREAVQDGSSGYLVRVKDKAQLINKIKLFLDESTNRKEMGVSGRKLMEEKFEKEKVVEQTIECIMG